MEQKEPCQLVMADQAQLLLESLTCFGDHAGTGVTAVELGPAQLLQYGLCRFAGIGEVGIAVSQIAGQVESTAIGHLDRAAGGVG